MTTQESPARTRHSRWPAVLLICGLLLMLNSPALVWIFRDKLAEVGPQDFTALGYGTGSLALLDFAAGLPLGAILVALGGARLFDSAGRERRVQLPLLAVSLVYFAYHGTAAFRYPGVPFALLAAAGMVLAVLFLALVWSGSAGGHGWDPAASGWSTCRWAAACASSSPRGKPAASPVRLASRSIQTSQPRWPTSRSSWVRQWRSWSSPVWGS